MELAPKLVDTLSVVKLFPVFYVFPVFFLSMPMKVLVQCLRIRNVRQLKWLLMVLQPTCSKTLQLIALFRRPAFLEGK